MARACLKTLCSCLVSVVTPCVAVSAATLGEVPLQSSDGYLWLNVSVQGSARPLRFILDSGAASTILNLQTARRLGLALGQPQAVAGVHARTTAYRVEFRADSAGIALPGSILALDLGALGISCDRAIDGLLGADFFWDRVVQIDYAHRTMRLLNRASPGAHAETLRIKRHNDCLCVPLRIAGHSRQWMRIDTGCNSMIEWFASKADLDRLKAGGTSIGLAGGSVPYANAEVSIGDIRLPSVEIGMHDRQIFPGEAGLLGNAMLSNFSVTIDGRKNRLILEPREE